MGSIGRDDNFVPIQGDRSLVAQKAMTFAGGTANDPGDFDGTGNPATLFTVTGDVVVSVFGICNVDLVGAGATVEVGVASGTALLIAQTTATDIDENEAWIDATPALTEGVPASKIIGNGQDIIQTVGTANITAGSVTYYCYWQPLEAGASVV